MALFQAAGEPVAAALSRLLTAVEGAAGDAPESSLAAIDEAEWELREAGHLWGLALAEFIRMEVSMRTPDSDAAIAATTPNDPSMTPSGWPPATDSPQVKGSLPRPRPSRPSSRRRAAAREHFRQAISLCEQVGSVP